MIWYQAILILVVIANPNRYNIVEWFHRFSYLGATVSVRVGDRHLGRIRQAFRLFLGGASLLALLAIEHSITSHFHPAQWSGYQKNTVGAIMWVAIVVAQVNPPWSGISRLQARVTKYLCLLGLLASQSRQAGILDGPRPRCGIPPQSRAPEPGETHRPRIGARRAPASITAFPTRHKTTRGSIRSPSGRASTAWPSMSGT